MSPITVLLRWLSGNAQIAVITGMFDNDNYNWRSMTSPGITGLFNANCLASGAANLMRCYPGDNTYDGELTTVSLVNMESQFHSIYTTVATNGERSLASKVHNVSVPYVVSNHGRVVSFVQCDHASVVRTAVETVTIPSSFRSRTTQVVCGILKIRGYKSMTITSILSVVVLCSHE